MVSADMFASAGSTRELARSADMAAATRTAPQRRASSPLIQREPLNDSPVGQAIKEHLKDARSLRQSSDDSKAKFREKFSSAPPASMRRGPSRENSTTTTNTNDHSARKATTRFLKGTNIKKPQNADAEGFKAMMMHPMNLLLVFLPLGIAAHFLHWGDLWCFWLNFFALVPLAKILGDATEELAAALKNDMIAGLLNATFGNAVEVVFTIQSLRAGLVRIVKATLLGSVLSNTLLVLGMSFFFGGIFTLKKDGAKPDAAKLNNEAPEYKAVSAGSEDAGRVVARQSSTDAVFDVDEKIQSFSMLGALVNTSMLLVSCLTFSLVTIFRMVLKDDDNEQDNIVLSVSRISSIIIMMAYVAFIGFQLVTHKTAMDDQAEEQEDDVDHMSTAFAIVILFVTTATVSFCSELLVTSIAGVTEQAHLSDHFIGVILLPIVGNACEHAAAVRFAVQDKMGLSVSIAVGSSTQIALFVVPLSVIMGWCMGVDMDLNFGTLNCSLITLSVIVVLSMVVDGQSNWLQGYLLCSVYVIVSVMFLYLPNEINDGQSE